MRKHDHNCFSNVQTIKFNSLYFHFNFHRLCVIVYQLSYQFINASFSRCTQFTDLKKYFSISQLMEITILHRFHADLIREKWKKKCLNPKLESAILFCLRIDIQSSNKSVTKNHKSHDFACLHKHKAKISSSASKR